MDNLNDFLGNFKDLGNNPGHFSFCHIIKMKI